MLRLPDPMLCRSGPIPSGRGWLFEPKLDGFRCLTCTHSGRFRARSRRCWDMTSLLPEFAATLPADVQLDGELVALNREGVPDFHRLGQRMLQGAEGIALTYLVFDVLAAKDSRLPRFPIWNGESCSRSLRRSGRTSSLLRRSRTDKALRSRMRTRPRGGRGEAAARPVPTGRAALAETKNRGTRRFAEEFAGVRRALSGRRISSV